MKNKYEKYGVPQVIIIGEFKYIYKEYYSNLTYLNIEEYIDYANASLILIKKKLMLN